MLITIRELTPDDLALIPIWAANIRAEQFTSRLYSNAFRPENPQLPDPGALAWFAILADGQPVGHIWLEREISEIGVATLGILIGKPELLGKGIGGKAITLAVAASRERWPLRCIRLRVRKNNARAIACYERCGFTIVGEGMKDLPDVPPVAFHVMELLLATPA